MFEVFYLKDGLHRETANPERLKELLSSGIKIWIDLVDSTNEEIANLGDIFDLHPVTVEDLSDEGTRVKIEVFENYYFIVLYNLFLDTRLNKYEYDIVIGDNFIITKDTRKEIKILEKIKNDQKALLKILNKGPDFLLHVVMDRIIDSYFSILDRIDIIIEKTEDELFNDGGKECIMKVIELKRDVSLFKRIVVSEREELLGLLRKESMFVSDETKIYFRDNYDSIISIFDSLDSMRDSLIGIQDTYLSFTSNKLNEIMKVLTIIATIMMPLTLITGIYGMNFEVMPELKSPYGYYSVLFLMLCIGLSMVYYFRRKGWM
ncbi:MAG: Magnesium transport protein CorA [Candidatus Methanofastidiosum methylothiophilum]|uniref:Magnesium transport protein CorA n=1 Tax=Candidatus Methanofastidiosum methylothiophilum TaxID=1705564 RepID=A0A150INX8_9EURY|nr:MAG: Magnesium transport protein CorA [Candidatus Methanofastidiosum methylthiophilus]KYC46751.1 MAG: Magnesium transport protein CorA [Candidatus Methanofastidiosum methylthiophilus]KYC49236.1 MAG: Magnesium transport protein CorA [Candidatus Methanofastidiosum methylthiophilus]